MKRFLLIMFVQLIVVSSVMSQIQSDTSDNYWRVVMPTPGAIDIDMEKSLVGVVKDSVITEFVQNIGSWKFRVDDIYFQGADADAFSLVSGLPVYSIEPDMSHYAEFRFYPQRVGIHTAEIVIVTQAETLIRNIRGEGVQPQLQVLSDLIDFGKIEVGQYKDTLQVVTIKNISTVPIVITKTNHNFPNDVDFSTLAGGGNISISPGDEVKMDLRFEPSTVGRTMGTLEFHHSGFSSPEIVQLYGEGITYNPIIFAYAESFSELICETETTRRIEIINDGGRDLIISDFSVLGDNADDFALIGNAPIIIEPDSMKYVLVTFMPQSAGVKNAELVIRSNAVPDSVLSIPLLANRELAVYQIEPAEFNLGYIEKNQPSVHSITVTNSGTLPNSYQISHTENIEIEITEFALLPAQSTEIEFTYLGSDEGIIVSEEITIRELLCMFDNTISVYGQIIEEAPIITVDAESFTPLVCENQSSIDIEVSNSGSVDLVISSFNITGVNAADFSTSAEPITLAPGSSQTFNIDFSPQTPGVKNANLEIISNSQQQNIYILPLIAVKESTEYTSQPTSVNFGIIPPNQQRTINLTLTNTGSIRNTFRITHSQNLILSSIEETLEPAENVVIEVTYIGSSDFVDIYEQIAITESTCEHVTITELSGKVFIPKARLQALSLEAMPGDEVTVNIEFINSEDIVLAGINMLNVDLTFNPTLLYPLDYQMTRIDERTAVISLIDLPTDLQSGKNIADIRFKVGLGNAEKSGLLLSNLLAEGGEANIDLISGQFNMLGVCFEGGARLLNPTGEKVSMSISPNPTDGIIYISLNLNEDGYTLLNIVNSRGEIVYEINVNSVGMIEFEVKTDNLPSGTYFVNLQTPTISKSQQLLIVK